MISTKLTMALIAALAIGVFSAGAHGDGRVKRIKVLADKAPDNSTLKSIVESVTRGCKTNDAKAIAMYNYCRLMLYHRTGPGERGGVGALKALNVYGWSLCGGLHTIQASLWEQAGWKWRYLGWSNPGHATVEAFYDGQWHYLDVFLKLWVWKNDPNAPGGRTIACQEDIKRKPELITKGLVPDKARKPVYRHKGNEFKVIGDKANWQAPSLLVCGDRIKTVISGINSNRMNGSPRAWGAIKFDSKAYSTDVNLGPGQSLELMWRAVKDAHWWTGRKYVPDHSCGNREYRNCPSSGPVLEPYIGSNPDGPKKAQGGRRTFATGKLIFAPDFSNDAFMSALAARENVKWAAGKLVAADPAKPASITVRMQSPYIMSRAKGKATGADSVEVSVDGGKRFNKIGLANFDDVVGGKYAALVKIGFKELSALQMEILVQHNRCALPYLSPGANKITVSVADPKQLGDNRLVVTYAYATGYRTRSYEQIADRGAELGQGHFAEWSKTPTVVQKVFAAKDLPATFAINCPTPKDKYPVYPRMLFLRREIIAPGSKPIPLPKGAVEPKTGPGDELKTLPNPFLVGIAKPPKKAP